MHPTANHLLQLQELTLVREEQNVASGKVHLEQLDAAIAQMASELPPAVQVMFEKLTKRDRTVITPVFDNLCSGCGIQLPISLVQQVRMANEVLACPNCARYLYTPQMEVRNTRRRPGRFDVQKPGISRFSASSLMIAALNGTNRDSVIEELATRLEKEHFVDKAAPLIERALRREALFSTAVDHGLAFPHVRAVEGGALTLAVGLSEKGVHFDDPKEKPSHVFFFMVIPTSASSFYLKLLSGLTETFMHEEARKTLLSAKDDSELWKSLLKLTRKAIK